MSGWSRSVLVWTFVVVALGASASSPALLSAAEQPATIGQIAITRWATAALGQQQGECFPWMRRVVQAATGIVIGNDYRLGFLQAGAVEVSPQSARSGDIIQIAKDSDTGPFADYPGLHTAFILENQGGGKFKVVDSNSNFDGLVRIRDGYDPAAAAGRYPGLSFRIYRLPEPAPGAVVSTPPPNALSEPGNVAIGSAAEVAADGDCLRVRAIAGLSGAILGCLPTGTRVMVTQPGPDVDGYHWVTISAGAISGWASERYLRALSGGVVTPPPEPVRGRILSGVIPPRGIGLFVFSGGSDAELLTASGCPAETAAFWSFQDGRFVQLLPGVPVPIVNAEWREKFPAGIPSGTPLIGRCRPFEAPPEDASTVPGPAAPAPPVTVPAVPAASPPASSYTVVEGDSLSSIAERFRPSGVSFGAFLDELYEMNGLTADSVLPVGRTLRIARS